MTAPLRLDPDDVHLVHEGQRSCFVEALSDDSMARCSHCGTLLNEAPEVTTTYGRTNAGGRYGEVIVDFTVHCACGEDTAATIDWNDL